MFERRLKVVLTIPIFAAVILIARLYKLQIVQGETYRDQASRALIAPKRFLPPLRGSILDRFGEVLVSDEPAFDLSAHYGALSADADYVNYYARYIRSHEPVYANASISELEEIALDRILTLYDRLSSLTGTPADEYFARRDEIVESVTFLRDYIWKARAGEGIEKKKTEMRLREEDRFHTLIRDIDREFRSRIEVELGDLPFFQVVPSVRRVWRDGASSLCHLLGRTGQVSSGRLEEDPRKTDWLARYRAGDLVGVSGVEYLAEEVLRGVRGYEEENLDGDIIAHVDPIDGGAVRLSIDLALQEKVGLILQAALTEGVDRSGASCVILDVDTRQILAMVSIPGFDQDEFRNDYSKLRDNAKRRPLLFRAVAEEYQPGSIVKPVALLAGMRYGVVNAGTTYDCDGSYIDGSPHWHCWTHWKGYPGHGPVSAVEAIQHSCNLYFYDLGKRLNPDRLSSFYADFFYGPERRLGIRGHTGLIEERDGLIPTDDWISANRKRGYSWADGCNYAIGQGEMQITPLQAANMYATLAAGVYRTPTIFLEDYERREPQSIPGVTAAAWQTARQGLYRCVNEIGGTAYNYARMDSLTICGKTGSAQCTARAIEVKYVFELVRKSVDAKPDTEGRPAPEFIERLEIRAPTIEQAREKLGLPNDARPIEWKVTDRWPDPPGDRKDPLPHAWFAGYAPHKNPKIALALIIEHGGSGGHDAAPVGKQIFEMLMEHDPNYLGVKAEDRVAKRDDQGD